MNRKSLLRPGLYRICVTLPDRVLRLTGQLASKLRTRWTLILLVDSEKKETHAVFIGRDRQMTVRPARLVATDRARDLALLKIEGDPLPALKLGDSNTAREGWPPSFPFSPRFPAPRS